MIRPGVILLAVLMLTGNTQAKPVVLANLRIIETFTSSEYPVTGKQEQVGISTVIHYYTIDGLYQLESNLSQDLPADPKEAKPLVLKRIEHLGEDGMSRLQQFVTGLAKALQYGIDRYPAIVFDGVVVIYGVTDIHKALRYYQEWRERQAR